MRDDSTNQTTETYEHIPWSRLTLTNETADRGRWMYLAAALLVVAAAAAVVTRMIWRPDVASAVTSTTAIAAPAIRTPETLPPPSLFSEADLMASLPPPDVDRMVASAAEQYVRSWGSSGVESGWRYVEWTSTAAVEDLGDGRFGVTVVLQLIEGGPGDPVRRPVEAARVTVELEGDDLTVVDLPVPADLDPPALAEHAAVPGEPPPAIAAAAREVASVWGDASVLEAGQVGQTWRVVLDVESVAGPARLVAVWLTPDGEPVHPGG